MVVLFLFMVVDTISVVISRAQIAGQCLVDMGQYFVRLAVSLWADLLFAGVV